MHTWLFPCICQRALRQTFETEPSEGASTCKNFLWWNVITCFTCDMLCIERVCTLAHETARVPWLEVETWDPQSVCLWRRSVPEPQVLCLTLYTSKLGGHMEAKHTNMGQGHEDRWGLWWELNSQSESLSILMLLYDYVAISKKAFSVRRSNRLFTEQVHSKVGTELV